MSALAMLLSLSIRLASGLAAVSFVSAGPPAESADPVPVASRAEDDETREDSARPSSPSDEQRMRERARRVRALIDGTLEPEVDPSTLLRIDLTEVELMGAQGKGLAEVLQAPPPRKKKRARGSGVADGADDTSPAQELRAALAAFSRLPSSEQAEVLEAHARRRRAAQDEREALGRKSTRLSALEVHVERLTAFLGGSLDPDIDPRELLSIDLTDPAEMASVDGRRDRVLRAIADGPLTADGTSDQLAVPAAPVTEVRAQPEDPSLDERLRTAEDRLDGLRVAWVRLGPEAQRGLFEAHARLQEEQRAARAQQAQADDEAETEIEAEPEAPIEDEEVTQEINEAEEEAVQAAAEREAALETARRARTEARRLVAEEQARLLGVKEAQAHREAEVQRRKTERSVNHEKSLEWTRKLSDLRERLAGGESVHAEADTLYDALRTDLASLRGRLRDELARIRTAGTEVPSAGPPPDAPLPIDVDRGDLAELRAAVSRKHDEIVQLEIEVAWELARGLRDDVVRLNRARLSLLEMASPTLRDAVTGFGPTGIDQIRRELEQISLELRYHALHLPRDIDALVGGARVAPLRVLLGVGQLAALLLAFSWWRRHAPSVLLRLQRRLSLGSRDGGLVQTLATLIWYARRVRKPLELLGLLWIATQVTENSDALPELELFWIVLRWVLLGLSVILFVDALAAREHRFAAARTDTSRLRIRSLRLVGLNVIAVGLLLALTEATVGRGAIYSWVLSTCWLLSFPVAFYLVYRWRPIVFERLEHIATPFAAFLRRHDSGIASYGAAALGSGYLLVRGVGQWMLRQVSGLDTTRRVLAYLFRREVARRAAGKPDAGDVVPISPERRRAFAPELDAAEILPAIAVSELRSVVDLVRAPRATLTAIVGERGAGKTTFLRALELAIQGTVVHQLSCPEAGVDALLAKISAITSDPTARDEQLVARLRDLGPVVVAIDDAHRLMLPAVRGLRGLDRFTAFARSVAAEVSWVLTFDTAAWHYVRRARGHRVFFEQVVDLPHWSEEQLGELFEVRSRAAGLEPSYAGLVMPRRGEALAPEGLDRTRQGYHRLLWDHANGNPAVALHAFSESLFEDAAGNVVVRMFSEPPAKEIESLALPLLFVLRAIVQLELALEAEIVAATHLPPEDVANAVRFCMARRYLEPHEGGVRVSWPWFRTITRVLHRQHLLSLP